MEFIQKHKRKLIITLILLVILLLAGSLTIFRVISDNVSLSRQQAQQIALDEFGGRVVETEIDQEILKTYYKIDIIDDNYRNIEIVIDASNGTIVEVDYDD